MWNKSIDIDGGKSTAYIYKRSKEEFSVVKDMINVSHECWETFHGAHAFHEGGKRLAGKMELTLSHQSSLDLSISWKILHKERGNVVTFGYRKDLIEAP